MVLDAATRLWRLIEKVLDLSLLQAGRVGIPGRELPIREVLHESVEPAPGHPTGTFQLSVESGLPLLRGDPAQLERAFANVLENAARYLGREAVIDAGLDS